MMTAMAATAIRKRVGDDEIPSVRMTATPFIDISTSNPISGVSSITSASERPDRVGAGRADGAAVFVPSVHSSRKTVPLRIQVRGEYSWRIEEK